MQHADPTQFAGMSPAAHSETDLGNLGAIRPAAAPDFDPEHPDAEILEAFANVRALRTTLYRLDDLGQAPEVEAASEPLGERCTAYEEGVTGNWATTASGIAARLMLAIPEVDGERWIDRGLMEHGLFAFYQLKSELDFSTFQVTLAAYELMHLEWETAFATYERLVVDRQFARTTSRLITAELEGLRSVGLEPSDELLELSLHTEAMERRFDIDAAVRRLVHTPAPDLIAYRRKVEVIQRENYQADGAVWLLRDANFLFDTITHGSPIVTPDPMLVGDAPAAAEGTSS